jgi:hypothetical protein
MQSVRETSLPSRSVTATVVSKTYRRTRDTRALSTQAGAFSSLQVPGNTLLILTLVQRHLVTAAVPVTTLRASICPP